MKLPSFHQKHRNRNEDITKCKVSELPPSTSLCREQRRPETHAAALGPPACPGPWRSPLHLSARDVFTAEVKNILRAEATGDTFHISCSSLKVLKTLKKIKKKRKRKRLRLVQMLQQPTQAKQGIRITPAPPVPALSPHVAELWAPS